MAETVEQLRDAITPPPAKPPSTNSDSWRLLTRWLHMLGFRGHFATKSRQGAKTYGHGKVYLYAHDHTHAIAAQQYLPDELTDALYYEPTHHGAEAAPAARLARIEELLGWRGSAG